MNKGDLATKVISGTKQLKTLSVVKSYGDIRKLRCQGCQGLALATSDGKGGNMHRCTTCGLVLKSIAM